MFKSYKTSLSLKPQQYRLVLNKLQYLVFGNCAQWQNVTKLRSHSMEHKIHFSEGLKFSIGSIELEIPIVNIDGEKCLLPPFLVIDL